MKNTISIIILGNNVAAEVEPAFKSSLFADEIIYVDTDTGSTDNTLKIAKKYATKIVESPGYNFSKWRNDGAANASGEWLLYLDSDERIPPELAQEVNRVISMNQHTAYAIPRYEIFLGKHLDYWPHPFVLRLMKKDSLKKWHGKLHEQPQIDGSIGKLTNKILHLSHKNIDEKLTSTLKWSKLEAQMLYSIGHPQMKGWRFFRILATEFWDRFVIQGLWRDGTEGIIEVIYQMFSRFISYERLWEMQRKPSLGQTYRSIDRELLKKLTYEKGPNL